MYGTADGMVMAGTAAPDHAAAFAAFAIGYARWALLGHQREDAVADELSRVAQRQPALGSEESIRAHLEQDLDDPPA